MAKLLTILFLEDFLFLVYLLGLRLGLILQFGLCRLLPGGDWRLYWPVVGLYFRLLFRLIMFKSFLFVGRFRELLLDCFLCLYQFMLGRFHLKKLIKKAFLALLLISFWLWELQAAFCLIEYC